MAMMTMMAMMMAMMAMMTMTLMCRNWWRFSLLSSQRAMVPEVPLGYRLPLLLTLPMTTPLHYFQA
jgi:hypothetical protein